MKLKLGLLLIMYLVNGLKLKDLIGIKHSILDEIILVLILFL